MKIEPKVGILFLGQNFLYWVPSVLNLPHIGQSLFCTSETGYKKEAPVFLLHMPPLKCGAGVKEKW